MHRCGTLLRDIIRLPQRIMGLLSTACRLALSIRSPASSLYISAHTTRLRTLPWLPNRPVTFSAAAASKSNKCEETPQPVRDAMSKTSKTHGHIPKHSDAAEQQSKAAKAAGDCNCDGWDWDDDEGSSEHVDTTRLRTLPWLPNRPVTFSAAAASKSNKCEETPQPVRDAMSNTSKTHGHIPKHSDAAEQQSKAAKAAGDCNCDGWDWDDDEDSSEHVETPDDVRDVMSETSHEYGYIPAGSYASQLQSEAARNR